MGTMVTEPNSKTGPLTVSKEPVKQPRAGQPGSIGDQAVKDVVTMIIIAWVLLFLLAFSLRKYNV